MELWIRSQDKKTLSKINEDIVIIGGIVRKLLSNENCWTDLGTYKNEERALEVLDEIQTLLINQCVPPELKLYEMPKE